MTESVTVDDVANQTGVAKGTFYTHFNDLNELAAAVDRRTRVRGQPGLPDAMRLEPVRQMRCTEEMLTPAASAIAAPVQCVASPGDGSSFGMCEGRVSSRRSRRRRRRRNAPAGARRRSCTCRSRA